MRRFLRVLALILVMAVLAIAAGVVWGRGQLRGSLPQIAGARSTGSLHAQARFLRMDRSRRRAAGELAALVGSQALPVDREIRIHRFRAEARRAVSLLRAADREVLDAYTAGVNAGLQALS